MMPLVMRGSSYEALIYSKAEMRKPLASGTKGNRG
jgi:hypothetical protein